MPPQAEAPPIDKEGTLRNTDWPEADRTRKAEVRIPSEESPLSVVKLMLRLIMQQLTNQGEMGIDFLSKYRKSCHFQLWRSVEVER
ncbi:hypothetical protein T03_16638 [Trichinella britovi]|uniref:Uncharacterized protein n=1 Tax=Trichinella britovi TaxID=45882 RepID=A0A0V1D024_TRIBR|nr:hypothetical protein T03_16638 [Trichinella britovi]KRZ82686.1 hypothetical protein T08_14073 [Trichinella sp. T8]